MIIYRNLDGSNGSIFIFTMGEPCWYSSYQCYIIFYNGFPPLLRCGNVNRCTGFAGDLVICSCLFIWKYFSWLWVGQKAYKFLWATISHCCTANPCTWNTNDFRNSRLCLRGDLFFFFSFLAIDITEYNHE